MLTVAVEIKIKTYYIFINFKKKLNLKLKKN